MGFKLGSENRKIRTPQKTPILKKKLDKGILAEANKDGTIYVDESVEPGSEKEREILMHEMKHLTDIKVGRLAYEDEWIKWDGQKYPREKGKILYEGEWIEEGGKQFPWEKHLTKIQCHIK